MARRAFKRLRANLMIPDVRLYPVPQLARVTHIPQVEKAYLRVHLNVKEDTAREGPRLDIHAVMAF